MFHLYVFNPETGKQELRKQSENFPELVVEAIEIAHKTFGPYGWAIGLWQLDSRCQINTVKFDSRFGPWPAVLVT